VSRVWALTGLLLVTWLLVSLGCAPADSSRRDNRPAGQGPGDSLAKLALRLLEDPDPATIAQAIICEHGRLRRLYGPHKAHAIAREVEDTIYSWRDQAGLRRVDVKLANRVFRTECASDSSQGVTRPGP
jgi:hypothetical protein